MALESRKKMNLAHTPERGTDLTPMDFNAVFETCLVITDFGLDKGK